jgi:hypothetical protein
MINNSGHQHYQPKYKTYLQVRTIF